MKLKRLLLIVGGLILLAALLCVGSGLASRISEQFSTPTPEAAETSAEVAVRCRGEVVPALWADLSFGTSGNVAEWLVAKGNFVRAGTPLGRLDTTTLELALEEARAALETAELRLAQVETEHERQLAEAKLALQAAEARLAQARARFPTLTTAEVALQQAIRAEADAAYEYEKAKNRPWEWEEVRNAYTRAWENAKDNLAIAQANYDAAVAGQYASSQELTILEGEVERARLQLERLQEGVNPLLARDVESARLRVTRAQAELEAATLIAPFDGTVVALHVRSHDWAGAGTPAVTLADLSTLRIETTDLDEWGAAQIRVGREATVVFTAFDDKTLTGHVTEIGLRGKTLPAGDVVYRAIIVLDEPDPDLRWGMTVRITIPLEGE